MRSVSPLPHHSLSMHAVTSCPLLCAQVTGFAWLAGRPAAGLRGQLVSTGLQREKRRQLSRLLLSSPFPLCQRQFSLDLRVGTGSFKAFPVPEFIFGLRKRKRKQARGGGCRSGGTGSGRAPRLCRPREGSRRWRMSFLSSQLGCPCRSLG